MENAWRQALFHRYMKWRQKNFYIPSYAKNPFVSDTFFLYKKNLRLFLTFFIYPENINILRIIS